MLAHAGAAVDADDLVREVYVAGLRGSLQPELLGATRRHGFIPYVIEPDAGALVAELAARRPVLVLQNLGFDRVPVWHYAVVVGLDGDDVILRSGTEQRRVERSARFLRSWQRGVELGVRRRDARRAAGDRDGRRLRSRARRRGAAARRARPPSAAIARRSSAGRATSSCCSRRPANGMRPATSRARRRSIGSCSPPRRSTRRRATTSRTSSPSAAATPKRSTEARAALAALAPADELGAAVRDTVAELERAETPQRRRRAANDVAAQP